MRVTEDNTNLRRSSTLLSELADLVDDLVGGGLEPGRGGARVGDGRGGNALSLAVKTTHFVFLVFGGDGGLSTVVGCVEEDAKSSRWNFFGDERRVECGSRERSLRLWYLSRADDIFLPITVGGKFFSPFASCELPSFLMSSCSILTID